MRIALFTDTFIPKVDGIVTTLCQTVKQLQAFGHEVLIFAPQGGFEKFGQSRIVGVKGCAFPFYPELRLCPPRASIRGELRAFQPDLIHVAEPVLLGIAGLYYAGGANGGELHLPLVVSYHTDLPKYLHYYRMGFLEPWIWPILRQRHNRATVNLCTSGAMVRQLRDHGIARVAFWPGGVDSQLFQPDRRSDEMRSRLTQGQPANPLLLYVGRLSAEKEIERLKPILQALPQARLALVGDGPHRKPLERHFAGLPVFMAGFLRGEELAAAYASSDVLVMPSRTETLGLVVLEAMSAGLPVVAARAGGIPEMIRDGVSGFLFDRESEAVAAIRQLMQSAPIREQIGKAAREHAVEHSWKAATSSLLEHYRAACEQPFAATQPRDATAPSGPRISARQALKKTTLFTLRKLFP